MAFGSAFYSEEQLHALLGLGEEDDDNCPAVVSAAAPAPAAPAEPARPVTADTLEDAVKRGKQNTTNEYCDDDNAADYMSAVEAKLKILGIHDKSLDVAALLARPDTRGVGVAVVNTLYAVIHLLEAERCDHQLKSEETRKAKDEVDNLTSALETVQCKLGAALDERAFAHRQLSTERAQFEAERQKLAQKNKEMQKQVAAMTSREAQYRHEMNRKDRMLDGLKERLRTSHVTKNKQEKASMALLESLASTGQQAYAPGAPACDSTKCAMYRKLMQEHCAEARHYADENQCLRQNLAAACGDLHAVAQLAQAVARGERATADAFAELCKQCAHGEGARDAPALSLDCAADFQLPAGSLCAGLFPALQRARQTTFEAMGQLGDGARDREDEQNMLEEMEEHRMRAYDADIEVRKKDLLIGEMQDEVQSLRKLVRQLKDKEASHHDRQEHAQVMIERDLEEAGMRLSRAQREKEELLERIRMQNEQQSGLAEKLRAEQAARLDDELKHKANLQALMGSVEEQRGQLDGQSTRMAELMEEVQFLEEKLDGAERRCEGLLVQVREGEEGLRNAQQRAEEKEQQAEQCAEDARIAREKYLQLKAAHAGPKAPQPKAAPTRKVVSSRAAPSTSRPAAAAAATTTTRAAATRAAAGPGPTRTATRAAASSAAAAPRKTVAASKAATAAPAQKRVARQANPPAIVVEEEELSMIEPVETLDSYLQDDLVSSGGPVPDGSARSRKYGAISRRSNENAANVLRK